MEEAAQLASVLLAIKLNKEGLDGWLWLMDSSKLFTVKSCYSWLVNSNNNSGLVVDSETLYAALWRCATSSKVLIFGWRLFHDSFPTLGLLLHRHVIDSEEDANCPVCRLHCEGIHHLFMDCCFNKDVWLKVYS